MTAVEVATYDPDLCARLVSEARQHDSAMSEFVSDPDHRPDSAVWFMRASRPENARGIEWMRANLRTMAGQLEAAHREVDDLHDANAKVRDANLKFFDQNQQLTAERDALRTDAAESRVLLWWARVVSAGLRQQLEVVTAERDSLRADRERG